MDIHEFIYSKTSNQMWKSMESDKNVIEFCKEKNSVALDCYLKGAYTDKKTRDTSDVLDVVIGLSAGISITNSILNTSLNDFFSVFGIGVASGYLLLKTYQIIEENKFNHKKKEVLKALE